MRVKVQVASLITLGLLSGFVLAIILAISYLSGYISWYFMIGLTILFNLAVWLVGPTFSDLMYKWFYKITFYDYEQIKNYPYMQFVKRICDEHNMRVPKIGIIDDQNPTAFTYGSGKFNARIVLTKGLFTYLNEEELEAVLAHELGHVVHNDFIIMTIAATLLQILYEAYVILARVRHRKVGLGKTGEKKGNYLVVVGYVSLLLHWIGTYILLYLSRTREYYADEFAAEKTGDPNHLSSALIKIAYGIAVVPDTGKTAHLLNNTRSLGIFDHKAAGEVGLVYQNSRNTIGLVEKALAFDFLNPWATLHELKSTHPLIGKRVRALCKMTPSPAFDFERVLSVGVDKARLWKNFFKDFFIQHSTTILFFVYVGFLIRALASGQFLARFSTTAVFMILIILFAFIKIKYKYSLSGFKETSIIELMSDIYASPIRGRPVKLDGVAVGKGAAGAMFSEDMMFQDKTGLIYLNYESGIPIFGNLFFAFKKLEKLFGVPASSKGWFMRGATHHLELYRFQTGTQTIKSYVRFWQAATTILLAAFVVGIMSFVIM
jgi:Zn-dependent protease with chaperone function